MRHAAVTFGVVLALRLFGVSSTNAFKVGTVVSIGGEIVQWHVGPCRPGHAPSPLCGKPERRDAFAGVGGALVAVTLTIPLRRGNQ